MSQASAAPLAAGAPAVGTLYLKEKGGRIHIFEDARIGQPLGAFSDRLREKELSVRSLLYGPITDAQWEAFKNIAGSEDAFLLGPPRPKPVDDEKTVVVAKMRLLAVPPSAPVGGGMAGLAGPASGLFSIPENTAIAQLTADMTAMKGLLTRQTKKNPPANMSKASTRAFQAAERANGFVVRRRPYPSRVPVAFRSRIPAIFSWMGRSEYQANADLLSHLRKQVVEGVEELKKLGLFTMDATGVSLQYKFADDDEEEGTGEVFTLNGKTDAIIVDNAAAGISASSPDPGLAMASSIMFVDYKTTEKMAAAAASPVASGGAGTGSKRKRVEADDDKPTGDLVMRQLIFQMLAFHASYDRWIPVVATDFATAIRIWEQDGTAIWEYGAKSKDGTVGPLSLEEGIAILRHLLDKRAKLMPEYDAKLLEPEEEDFDNGGDAPGSSGGAGGGGSSGSSSGSGFAGGHSGSGSGFSRGHSGSGSGGVGGKKTKGGNLEAQEHLEPRLADDEQARLRLRYNIQRIRHFSPMELLKAQ